MNPDVHIYACCLQANMSVPSVDVIPVYAPKRQVHEVHMVDQPFRRFTLTETSTSAYIHTCTCIHIGTQYMYTVVGSIQP
jgi:hypothetical protein